jgi:hypothetical protein
MQYEQGKQQRREAWAAKDPLTRGLEYYNEDSPKAPSEVSVCNAKWPV